MGATALAGRGSVLTGLDMDAETRFGIRAK